MVKALEPSSCAAAAVGPKMSSPREPRQIDHTFDQRRFRSDDGQLHVGRGEVRQLLDGQHVDGDVLALGFSGGACIAGATYTLATRGSCATFQARACSRPPLPMISTFISLYQWRRAGSPLGG